MSHPAQPSTGTPAISLSETPAAPPRTLTEPDVDLASCDREPIHVPGSIQPHGFLLALDPETLLVREASENAAAYLDRPLSSLFGQDMAELLGAEQGARLLAELDTRAAEPAPSSTGLPDAMPRLLSAIVLPAAGNLEAMRFDVVAHRTGSMAQGGQPLTGRVIVECERVLAAAEGNSESLQHLDAEALNARIYNFVSANRGKRKAVAVIQAAVSELRVLTGCDRVVLYSFDEDGHGLVLAEDRGVQFASYLGLRFPASDVPKQARRMYELNRVRIIPNVDYQPSPLVSPSGTVHDLDLSFSVLRSVSPVHRAYMRNMGTACSMSVSILIEGKLWGLVSCHHHEPRYVPLRLRSACDFVMQVVSAQLESQSYGEHLERVLHARALQAQLLSAMAARENYMDGLLVNAAVLQELLEADGVAIVQGASAHLFGVTPPEDDVVRLADWLAQRSDGEIFASSHLSGMYPEALGFAATGSGLVAASLSKIHRAYVLWFRPELVATVRWAGDPHKPALPQGASPPAPGVTVNPRHSFEEWSQIVRARSAPWAREQVAAAAELRSSVLEIVLKRAEEMAELAADLKVANEELEAFSYSVSHDLRAPFRHISGFSEMLREEDGERMSPKGLHYLSTIMESARFAGMLVDSLLDFSRIGRAKLLMMQVDMDHLVDEEWAAVLADEGGKRAIEFLRGSLPRVSGDPSLLRQVLRNLLSNAVKYTGTVDPARIEMTAREEGRENIFSLKDNGVGFDPQYASKLFGVFQRLHRAEDFEGTGIGLANVRRIVARHGGRTWAEAELGQGATFFFSLPVVSVREEE